MTDKPNRPTIFAIVQEHQDIMLILQETEGELTPELEARLDACLRSSPDKLDAAAAVWRRIKAEAEMADEESKRMADRKKMFQRDADNLRARMLMLIDEVHGGKIKTAKTSAYGVTGANTVTVGLAADADLNTIAITDPSIVRTTHELNKSEIQRRLAAGEAIPPEVAIEDHPGKRYLVIK